VKRTAILTLIGLAFVATAARAEEKGTVTEIDGLKSTTPATWKAKENPGQFRVYQFTLPKEKGDQYDGDLIVFFFNKGQGGTVESNITRWKGMITPPEGKKIDDVSKIEEIKIGSAKAIIFDATGTYLIKARPMDTTGEKRENYRLIAAQLDTPNGPYFIRATGPAKTMEAHKKGFDEWLKGMK
jgi:hypothetical protein